MNLPFYAYLPVVAGIIGGLIGGYYYKQYKKNHPNKKK
jgi:glycerol uptake facilitator-like aquaporin